MERMHADWIPRRRAPMVVCMADDCLRQCASFDLQRYRYTSAMMGIEDSCRHGLPASRCGVCELNRVVYTDRELDRLRHEDPTICNDCGASDATRHQCEECREVDLERRS